MGPYIASVLTALMLRRGLPNDVEEAVQVRLDKQRVIHEGDRRFAVILEESVLRAAIAVKAWTPWKVGWYVTQH
ncbi:Scr1 family TA system antitoxin-like transcriptional regulator [Nonomuraea sp. NPDC050022]|uniref:Scr1 family TA system antitoxin-like transcriptional regulator n=1 Tax=Nonomuraea sp. NPDC050022 TaxID=3364358 RepID=UPI00378EBC67